MEEAYQHVCAVLTVLCPRLVPSPLWGAPLARLARLKAGEAFKLGVDEGTLRQLKAFWYSIPRRSCAVCGAPAEEVDEEWRYCLAGSEHTIDIARLTGLRSLCRECHLAKHLGYASVKRELRRALQHLARVIGVDSRTVAVLLPEVGRIRSALSDIESWRITVDEGVLPESIRSTRYHRLHLQVQRARRPRQPALPGFQLGSPAQCCERISRATRLKGSLPHLVLNLLKKRCLLRTTEYVLLFAV